jgi:hypothetical protein
MRGDSLCSFIGQIAPFCFHAGQSLALGQRRASRPADPEPKRPGQARYRPDGRTAMVHYAARTYRWKDMATRIIAAAGKQMESKIMSHEHE